MQFSGTDLLMLSSLVLASGCVSPMTTRLPNLAAGDPYIERQAALTKDPFPDNRAGPDVSFRPADYQKPRSEPRQIKEKFFTWAKPQFSPSGPDPAASTSWILPPMTGAVAPPPVSALPGPGLYARQAAPPTAARGPAMPSQ